MLEGEQKSGEGGKSDLLWKGCAARASKPLPILKVILAEKGTHF